MSRLETIAKYRNNLHQIPELGFKEFKTSKYIRNILESFGYEVFSIVETGLYVYINNNCSKTIAFRCDMDALPIFEQTNRENKSKHPNVMHACGHDAHMAIMLQFAKELKENNNKSLNVNIVLLFQPSEERDSGAKKIVDSKILNKFKIDSFFGLHVKPEIQSGFIGTKKGEFMARSCEFEFKITTKSTHGAQPQNGVDAIVVGSNFVNQIHTIISRNLNPINTGCLTIGTINGGYENNICASVLSGKGTIRTFSEYDISLIIERMSNIAKGLEISFDANIKLNFKPSYPEVCNDEKLYEKIKTIDNVIEVNKEMIAEDFSYYSEISKTLFAFLGIKTKNLGTKPLHSSEFDLNEESLLYGVDYFHNILKIMS